MEPQEIEEQPEQDQEYLDQKRQANRFQAGTLATIFAWMAIILGLALLLTSCSMPALATIHRVTVTPAPPTEAPAAPAQKVEYIRKQDPTPTPTLGPATCTVTGTNGARLNIRKDPGLHAEILGSVPEGTTLTVISFDGSWTVIETGTLTGYIFSIFCEGK